MCHNVIFAQLVLEFQVKWHFWLHFYSEHFLLFNKNNKKYQWIRGKLFTGNWIDTARNRGLKKFHSPVKHLFVKGKTQAPNEVIIGIPESKIILVHSVHQLNVNFPSLVALSYRHNSVRKSTLQESIQRF